MNKSLSDVGKKASPISNPQERDYLLEKQLEKHFDQLSEKSKVIITLYMADDMEWREIARLLNIRESNARSICAHDINKLRKLTGIEK